ncbi:hypothetical protein [Halolamina sp.]|uniref:hypothetical protein n=1 Tax=Halolamina sp. TaxID=1940283 RepID=UPI003566D7A4
MSDQTIGGLETPTRREESDGFECKSCGFAAPDREDFATFGLAMTCPECGSTRVEHLFGEAE